MKIKFIFSVLLLACALNAHAKSITLLKEVDPDQASIWTMDDKKLLSLPRWDLTSPCPFSIDKVVKWIADSGKIDLKKNILRSARIMLPSESMDIDAKGGIYICAVTFEERSGDDIKCHTFVILSTGEFVEPEVVKQ